MPRPHAFDLPATATSTAACWAWTVKLSFSAASTHFSMLAGCGGCKVASAAQAADGADVLADEHAQRVLLDLQIILPGQFLCAWPRS